MILRADAREIPLVDGCVQCCVTSPPYWGQRDYGNSQQIGLEATPDAYVAQIVAVFREVRRVLRKDGTVWLNLGDSYSGSGKGGNPDEGKQATNKGSQSFVVLYGKTGKAQRQAAVMNVTRRFCSEIGAKSKDLVGIPWRVAFALQADGWYLRSDIIWAKPNPMPEYVTDRPTRAHEYLFLLAKSKLYYYDAAAIYERYAESTLAEIEHGYDGLMVEGLCGGRRAESERPSDTKRRIIASVKRKQDAVGRSTYVGFNDRYFSDPRPETGRNKRSVWTIPRQIYSGSHFATMPEALIEPCILAGCPIGGVVLDPFLGSGTVGAVAERLSRRWVGCDLAYQELAAARTAQRGLSFAEANL